MSVELRELENQHKGKEEGVNLREAGNIKGDGAKVWRGIVQKEVF